jgi:hypothetical protein
MRLITYATGLLFLAALVLGILLQAAAGSGTAPGPAPSPGALMRGVLHGTASVRVDE